MRRPATPILAASAGGLNSRQGVLLVRGHFHHNIGLECKADGLLFSLGTRFSGSGGDATTEFVLVVQFQSKHAAGVRAVAASESENALTCFACGERNSGSRLAHDPCLSCLLRGALDDEALASGTTASKEALAATAPLDGNKVFNVGTGTPISLLAAAAGRARSAANHAAVRAGDILQSQADVSRIERTLGYQLLMNVVQGLQETFHWYEDRRF